MILDETTKTVMDLYGESLRRITVERAVMGISMTGVVLSNGYGGIAFTPLAELTGRPPEGVSPFLKQKPMRLKGMPVCQILNSLNNDPLANTLKIVVLNALSALFINWRRYLIVEDNDAMDSIDFGSRQKVCVVGATPPPSMERFGRFSHIGLYVMGRGRDGDTRGNGGNLIPIEAAPTIIPLCDTVILGDWTITNETVDRLLDYTRRDSRIIVSGPGAGFLPDAFFRRNVTVVNTVSVARPDKVLDMIAEGMNLSHIFTIRGALKKISLLDRSIQMEYTPGVAAVGG